MVKDDCKLNNFAYTRPQSSFRTSSAWECWNCPTYFAKFSINFDEVWCTVGFWNCWFGESHVYFIWSIFRGENTALVFSLFLFFSYRYLETNFFLTWHDDKDHWTLQFLYQCWWLPLAFEITGMLISQNFCAHSVAKFSVGPDKFGELLMRLGVL